MFERLMNTYERKHMYTLAATGIKFRGGTFNSRQIAENVMYDYIDKHGLHVNEVWDDKHFKTYCCNNGIKFYVNRI